MIIKYKPTCQLFLSKLKRSVISILRVFASTVLLFNNVTMEIVSRLLRHSKLQTTQESYGKVVQKRISLEMES